jgi:hypothetical protein
MTIPHFSSLTKRVSFFVFTAACASGLLFAESAAASSAPESSSSSSVLADLALPDGMGMGSGAAAASQDGHRGTAAGWRSKATSNFALEFGGGFNAPHPDSTPYITWGGHFNVGAGYNFSPRLALLAEYQFIDDKLPGNLIAETGANGGNAHIWSLTLQPVVSLFPKSANDLYLTGGGGFYRKVTNFTDPMLTEWCDYYYCSVGTTNQVVGHFSSNQGGWNIGLGYQRHIGGAHSRMKYFVEARYLNILTPAVTTQPNGLGTTTVGAGTTLIPVTVGVRW